MDAWLAMTRGGTVGGERLVLMEKRYADEDVRFSVGAENDNGVARV